MYHLYVRSFHQPSIFLSFTLSFILHAVLIGMLLFFQSRTFIKERERFIAVSIYVNKENAVPSLAINAGSVAKVTVAENTPHRKVVETPETSRLMPKEVSRDALIEESIHAIKAKKRIEKLARLRAEITGIGTQKTETVDEKSKIRGERSVAKVTVQEHSESGSFQKGLPGYRDIVKTTIQTNWHYPELAKKGLTAVVVIYVGKDGATKIIDFKTSGERLFDYSIKNAILKSSPLPPPPEECEIELRFSR